MASTSSWICLLVLGANAVQLQSVGAVADASLGQKGSNLRSVVGTLGQTLFPTSCIADSMSIGAVGRYEDDYPFTPNCNQKAGTDDMSCFHTASSHVLMEDGTYRAISKLRLGDRLAGAAGAEPNLVEGFLHT
eukprot:Blabericola_migrator_1__4208@NODE_228_length_11100_cov_168_633645_g194_i0_p11_GENE_NODE_228_length_11100_cov_168_633645_g194_i0NODE_228_length_11100_cov_168_633645_g194_i0_p11_ORF_typecomplete_len133_score1_17Hom_end_hint/PF05203_16/0_0049Hint/PF01079_20/0_021Vint/PF14623_6/0_029_NODE_228_length_11100_cov_168_633645_g194_i075107908